MSKQSSLSHVLSLFIINFSSEQRLVCTLLGLTIGTSVDISVFLALWYWRHSRFPVIALSIWFVWFWIVITDRGQCLAYLSNWNCKVLIFYLRYMIFNQFKITQKDKSTWKPGKMPNQNKTNQIQWRAIVEKLN